MEIITASEAETVTLLHAICNKICCSGEWQKRLDNISVYPPYIRKEEGVA